jgi:hypothetical protein
MYQNRRLRERPFGKIYFTYLYLKNEIQDVLGCAVISISEWKYE